MEQDIVAQNITSFISKGCPLSKREIEVLYNESEYVGGAQLSFLSNKKLLGLRLCEGEGSLAKNLALLVEDSDGRISCYFLAMDGCCWGDSRFSFNPHQTARLNDFCRNGSKDLTFIKIFDGASSAYRSNSFNVLFDPTWAAKVVITYSLMLGRETDSAPSPYYVTADFWWLVDDKEWKTDTGATYEKLSLDKFIQMRRVDVTNVLFEERDYYYTSQDC